jgi:metal-responsive CopG/Arc/MetJ family transcriptional regulator
MPKNDERIMISIRLPRSVIERIDKLVKEQTPALKDRTQVIEVALSNFIKSFK